MPKTDHRKNLTPTLIAGLKKARKDERYQVMDAQVPGFGVRVTDKGHKTFILRIRYPGSSTPSRREIGNCADISLTAARDKARRWRSLVAQGIDPVVEEEKERQERLRQQAFTFAAVADDFIRQKLSGERRGSAVEREIRRDLLPTWASKPIASITDTAQAFLPMGDCPAQLWTHYVTVRGSARSRNNRRNEGCAGSHSHRRRNLRVLACSIADALPSRSRLPRSHSYGPAAQ